MAVSRKVEREILRTEYLEKIIDFFKVDEEVLRVKSNEIAYEMKLKEKEKKAKKNAEKKAKKIAKDAEIRKKKKEIAKKSAN